MIALHLLPATPYPVLLGTPGPLLGFIATNGNWATLAFTIVLLLVDVFAYTPFVRMAFAVENELVREATESGEQHD
jgi:PTS system cellobiose-specific IIC component